MKTVCTKDNCTGCMACVESCPQNAIKVVDELDSYNAVINEEQCANCDLCRKVCQNNRIVKFTQPIMWKQGWARDTLVRSSSSSGGVAQAIARNAGLDVATGQWICFVDGDDYIMPVYVSYMLALGGAYDADIALTTYMFGSFDNKQINADDVRIWTGEDAVEAILCYKVPIGCYCKIFKPLIYN